MKAGHPQLWLRAMGSLGLLAFGAALTLVTARPGIVEQRVTRFIEQEAADKIREQLDRIERVADEPAIEALARTLHQENAANQEALRRGLAERIEAEWAQAISEIRDLSCECRERIAAMLRHAMESRLTALTIAESRLKEFIQGQYMRVQEELFADLSIFAASNVLVFALLLVSSFLKPRATLQLFVPGLLLAASAVCCAGLYLFNQNWLMTVIYGDYVGAGYLAYVGVAFGLLCDVVLNQARLTSQIFNAVADALGSAVAVVPC